MIDLGNGFEAHLMRQDERYIGIVFNHLDHNRLSCSATIRWFQRPGEDYKLWNLRSLVPLSLEPSLVCPTCGLHGWIKDGEWETGTTLVEEIKKQKMSNNPSRFAITPHEPEEGFFEAQRPWETGVHAEATEPSVFSFSERDDDDDDDDDEFVNNMENISDGDWGSGWDRDIYDPWD